MDDNHRLLEWESVRSQPATGNIQMQPPKNPLSTHTTDEAPYVYRARASNGWIYIFGASSFAPAAAVFVPGD